MTQLERPPQPEVILRDFSPEGSGVPNVRARPSRAHAAATALTKAICRSTVERFLAVLK